MEAALEPKPKTGFSLPVARASSQLLIQTSLGPCLVLQVCWGLGHSRPGPRMRPMTQVTWLLAGAASLGGAVWQRSSLGNVIQAGESPCSESLHPILFIWPVLFPPVSWKRPPYPSSLWLDCAEFTAQLRTFTVTHHPALGGLALLHHLLPVPSLQLLFPSTQCYTWPAWRVLPTPRSFPHPGPTSPAQYIPWEEYQPRPSTRPCEWEVQKSLTKGFPTKLHHGDMTLTPDPACAGQPWSSLGRILINTPSSTSARGNWVCPLD